MENEINILKEQLVKLQNENEALKDRIKCILNGGHFINVPVNFKGAEIFIDCETLKIVSDGSIENTYFSINGNSFTHFTRLELVFDGHRGYINARSDFNVR